MCGRATLTASPDELREVFDLDHVPDMPPRFNIAPSQPLPVIREPRRLELFTWGAPGRHRVNARVESAPVAPAARCLVVVDGFYEWRAGDRQPFYFHRVDHKPFAVGGVITGTGMCVIATCPAAAAVVDIHDRMPVVLARGDWSRWLAGDKPAATLEGMDRYPVSKVVNSPRNDGPECLARAPAPDAQAQLGLFAPPARTATARPMR